MVRVAYGIEQALGHRNSYSSYTYLWADNRQEFLRQFLKYGHVLTTEEIEAAGTPFYIASTCIWTRAHHRGDYIASTCIWTRAHH